MRFRVESAQEKARDTFPNPRYGKHISLGWSCSAACQGVNYPAGAIGIGATAMGAMNNVFERLGEVSIGLTYMTGSLVKLGQRLGTALIGGDRFGWAPYAWLWTCFVSGVLGGAAAFPHVGLEGLWGGFAAAAVLAILAPTADD